MDVKVCPTETLVSDMSSTKNAKRSTENATNMFLRLLSPFSSATVSFF